MGAVVSIRSRRRHGITSQQLFGWRRSAGSQRDREGPDAPGFAAVMLEALRLRRLRWTERSWKSSSARWSRALAFPLAADGATLARIVRALKGRHDRSLLGRRRSGDRDEAGRFPQGDGRGSRRWFTRRWAQEPVRRRDLCVSIQAGRSGEVVVLGRHGPGSGGQAVSNRARFAGPSLRGGDAADTWATPSRCWRSLDWARVRGVRIPTPTSGFVDWMLYFPGDSDDPGADSVRS